MNFIFVAEAVNYRCVEPRFADAPCETLHNSTEVCAEWIYDNPHSLVAEFNLACQEWKRTLIGTASMMGYMTGLFFVGPISDRFGRKTAIITYGLAQGVIGIASSFSPSYWSFFVLQFVRPMLDICSPVFILGIEIVTHDKRVLYNLFQGVGYPMGFAVLALASWLFPYWRHLLRVLYIPNLLILFFYFLLDESPRWLLAQGRTNEAKQVLDKAASTNNMHLEDDFLENIQYQEDKGISYCKLLALTFRSKKLLLRFFLSIMWFTAATFVIYGYRIASVLLPGNKYLNFALMCPMSMLSACLSAFVMIRFRRKMPLMASFIFCAVLCFIQIVVPKDLPWISVTLHMVGYFTSAIFFSTIYVFVSELFPTHTRNSMHSLCSALGRGGSISATQIPLLLVYWEGLPSLVLGLVSLVAGLLTILAPDAADEVLPDTVHQAEQLDTPAVNGSFSDSMSQRKETAEMNTDIVRRKVIEVTVSKL
ncbi:sugar transporter domain-containing protein [Phthorimaea operculella]|nr:sugar transporter domain-containing protein [Phthorimaea operculella]